MKIILVGILLLLLTGCSSFGIKPKFPEVPDLLLEPCENLEELKGNNLKLSDLLKVVNRNYDHYSECKLKKNMWNEWYTKQKEIYGNIK